MRIIVTKLSKKTCLPHDPDCRNVKICKENTINQKQNPSLVIDSCSASCVSKNAKSCMSKEICNYLLRPD